MFNDYNELFTTGINSLNDFDPHNNIFYSDSRQDLARDSHTFELNFTDLEPIVPYESFSLAVRKEAVKDRYNLNPFDYDDELLRADNCKDKSFFSVDNTEIDKLTNLEKSIVNGKENILDHSFITNNEDCLLRKREELCGPSPQRKVLLESDFAPDTPIVQATTRAPPRLKKVKKSLSNKSKKSKKGEGKHKCKCAKSKCLRLYCQCFAMGLICGVDCDCTDCHNKEEFKPLRDLVIQETIEKNPYAFKSKYKKHEGKNNILHSRGCNCSKTGCVKEYCECFKAGTGCSRLCRCVNCKNSKIDIKDEEVKIYYDRVLRKRKKKSILKECFTNKKEILQRLNISTE